MKEIDNIKITQNNNIVTIKKGIIKKKYLVSFLIINTVVITMLFAILKELAFFQKYAFIIKILMYEITFVWILCFGIAFTGTLFLNLSLEKIEIIKDKKLIRIIGDGIDLTLTTKNKIKVAILVTKEHFLFTRASFKEMCTMTFTIDNKGKYKWGFRISQKKAEEIKKILENTMGVELNG